jgi:hypothetical protein
MAILNRPSVLLTDRAEPRDGNEFKPNYADS